MKNKKIILTTITGTFICVLFAILFFGIQFNDFEKPPIYFLILGITGSLSLALFKDQRIRDAIYINLLFYLIFTALILNIMRPIIAVIFFIYFTAMIMAIYVHVRYFDKKLTHLSMARPLILAAMVGLFSIGANFFHGLLFISQFSPRFLLGNLPIGFLLGLGFGLGEKIIEKALNKDTLTPLH
jgi:hypothetical protein